MVKKIISFLCLMFIVLACKDNQHQYKLSQVFRYNQYSNISSLDPAFARNQANVWAVNQLFDGLVALNDDLKAVPNIAKKWTISNQNTTYEFTLRNDVYFHKSELFGKDSTRLVNAYDFEYSFGRLTDAKVASPGKWVMQNVKNYQAINDSVFRINLKKSFPPFLGLLSMEYCSVVPKEVVQEYGSDFRSHPIGTGPFQFKLWVENTKLVFRKNPLFFEKDKKGNPLPYLEAVAVSFYSDKQTEFLQFIQGNLDVLNDLHTSYKDELLSPLGNLLPKYKSNILLDKTPYLITEYIAFFMEKNTTENHPYLREAISLGFDRAKMIKYLRNNIGQPATGFIPKGLPSYLDTNKNFYNPKKAKQLIDRYKKETGIANPVVKIATSSNYVDLFEFIQRELQGIGVEVKLEVLPAPSLRQLKANGKLPVFRSGWIADYPDGENFMSLFYSKNFSPHGPNYSHFKNETFDKLYEQSLSITDKQKRVKIYKQMDSIIVAKIPIVPLFYDEIVRFKHSNVKGLTTNATNLLNLKEVYKTEN